MTSTTKTVTTTTRTTTGSRRIAWLVAALLVAAPVWAAKKNSKQPAPFAMMAGTVFRTPGFALGDAEVTVSPETDEKDGVKFKKTQAVTNFRGEWAVRVPPVPMKYTVYVKCSGYESQEKTVTIAGEMREEVNFVLEAKAASK
jgi:CarboxypepD_reg-like domain